MEVAELILRFLGNLPPSQLWLLRRMSNNYHLLSIYYALALRKGFHVCHLSGPHNFMKNVLRFSETLRIEGARHLICQRTARQGAEFRSEPLSFSTVHMVRRNDTYLYKKMQTLYSNLDYSQYAPEPVSYTSSHTPTLLYQASKAREFSRGW